MKSVVVVVVAAVAVSGACGGESGAARSSPVAADDAAVVAVDAASAAPGVVFARLELEGAPAQRAALASLEQGLDASIEFAGASDSAVLLRISVEPTDTDAVRESLVEAAVVAKAPAPVTWWGSGAGPTFAEPAELLLRAPANDPTRFAQSFVLDGEKVVTFSGDGGWGLASIAGDSAESLEKLSTSAALKKALVRAGATGPADMWIATRFGAKL